MSPSQLRVLGCLIEKQRTTPDAYPLSLNSLRLACNQSTNRDPIVQYDEATIKDALHRLERRGMVRLASGAGSRAAKYRHLLAEALPMEDGEQAVMCVLMLRGGQTPGELKQRTERMHRFADLEEVGQTLQRLIDRGLVARLERRPGQKEERYEHLLGEEGEEEGREVLPASVPDAGGERQTAGAGDGERAGAFAQAPVRGVPAPAGELQLAAVVSRLERLEDRVGRIEELARRVGRLEGLMAELEPQAGEPLEAHQ